MQGKSIRWVLFDLGGVLVEIGGVVDTIYAATFLQHFVPHGIRWAHIDIGHMTFDNTLDVAKPWGPGLLDHWLKANYEKLADQPNPQQNSQSKYVKQALK